MATRIAGRGSLIGLLTNPSNIGHRVYNRRIVKWNAHEAIVDREDYDFALSHLGTVDLEGNPIERERRVVRYTQGQRREGLLAGTRSNGKPVITSSQGGVYVVQTNGSTAYAIKDGHYKGTYGGSIDIDTVDAAISQRLEDRHYDLMWDAEESDGLIATYQQAEVVSQGASELVEKAIAEGKETQSGARAILDHVEKLRQQVVGSLQQLDKTIADIENKIAFKQREYNAAKDVMSDTDIRLHFESLARMRGRLADLQEKRKQSAQVDQDIERVTTGTS